MRADRIFASACVATSLVLSAGAALGQVMADHSGGFLGIDRFDEREDRGVFSRSNQKRVDLLVLTGLFGTALWQGSESSVGRPAWQAVDAVLTTALATEALKRVFSRPRPSQDPNPDVWFAGAGHKSFPSGETAMMAAAVTPYIIAAQAEQPAVWALLALPLYMGTARMSSQAHWLTDVIGGAAVGFGMGLLASQREQPLVLAYTGRGAFVGWKARF
jgi:undecaprenyl-diphosphatase